MKTCSVCGKELPRPIDEFGDIRAPICMTCFFDQEPAEDDKRAEIQEI